MNERLNVFKITDLSADSNSIPNKILTAWKGLWIAKTILKMKNKVEGLTLSDFKT